MDALVAVEDLAVGSGAETPILNVRRWWEPQIPLPAVWHWLSPGDTERPDLCTVWDLLRVDVMVGVDPAVNAGRDMVELEDAAEQVREAVDAALYARAPLGGAVEWARRVGMRTQIQQFGQLGVLCIVLPVELRLSNPITT